MTNNHQNLPLLVPKPEGEEALQIIIQLIGDKCEALFSQMQLKVLCIKSKHNPQNIRQFSLY